MSQNAISIRPFIGAKDFALCRRFYEELGFEESILSHNMSLFSKQGMGFYLQDAYVKDWVDNTMLFLEVENVDQYWEEVLTLNLPAKYEGVRLVPIRHEAWGKEFFLHDPSGILWHFGEFFKPV
ncbi:MAG: glyoxalase [Ferruginibacter sp.]|nr:glyoxalase [Chitinophagaceae bacterium]